MLVGVVNTRWEARVRLPVKGADGVEHAVDAIVDTGFTGSLTLPTAVIARLGLPWRTRGTAELADGSIDEFDIHTGIVIRNGKPRHILVEAAETTPLVGMRLLRGCDLRVQVIKGGRVTIDALR